MYVDLLFERTILISEVVNIEKVEQRAELFIPILIRYWITQNNKILEFIAGKDVLLLRTNEISSSAQQLARFLDVEDETIDSKRTHENKGPNHTDWTKRHQHIFDACHDQIKAVEAKFELLAGKTNDTSHNVRIK